MFLCGKWHFTVKICHVICNMSVLLLFLQPDMNEDLFTQLIEQLVSQAPTFTKSVNFAKIMLTVLTKYGNLVSIQNIIV